ncbi:uncharacterized protein LOC118275310 [Spodoptera frugiperda]|uniref:Uncharacterized protein LOC118275310 n=1 Tax=Spodoptera frugiperda TaxID=7108 RepID=A0A9R0DRI9_SPOFR|nr:uncharacterized protein LOC118275310 [Spodoptera frugiperda]
MVFVRVNTFLTCVCLVTVASCLQRLGPDYVDSDDEEEVQLEEPNNRKRKSSDGTTGDEKRLRRSGKQIPASWISPTDLAEAGPSSYTHTAAHPQQSQPTSLSPVVSVQQDTIDQVLADLSDFSQLEKSDNDQLAPPVTECQSPAQYPSSLPGGSEQQQPEQQRPTSPRVHPYLLRGILAKLGYYSQLETSDNDQLVPPVTEYQSQDQYFAPQRYSDCDLQPTEQLQQQPTSPPVQPDLLEVEADLGLSSQLETSDNDQLAAPVTESPSQDQYFAPQQYLLPSSLPGGSEQQQPEQQQLRGILAYLGYYSSEPEPSLANQLAQPVTEYQSPAQYFAPQQCLLPSSLPGGSEQQQTEQLQQQQQQQPDLLEVSADLGYYSSELEPSPLYHQSQSYFYHHQNRYS